MFGNPVGRTMTRSPLARVASVALKGSTSFGCGVIVAIDGRTADAEAETVVDACPAARLGRSASEPRAAEAAKDKRIERMVLSQSVRGRCQVGAAISTL